MDMSKGNLKPVRGSRLPVKVGKDMNQEEICQLAIKKHCNHDQLSQTWSNMCYCIQIKN